MQILQIVLPVFAIIAFGYYLKKSKIAEDSWVHALNGFAYFVALPAIIVSSFWNVNWQKPDLLETVGLNALLMVSFGALLMLILQATKLKKELKASILITSVVGNTIYMGFPLGRSAFGEENFSLVAGAGSVHLVLGIALGILAAEFWTAKRHGLKNYFLDFIKNPLIVSLIVGIVLSLINPSGTIFGIVKDTVKMLGATASPVALFVLGAFLYGKFSRLNVPLITVSTFLKLAVFPAFMYFATKLFGLQSPQVEISALLSGMPAAATTFVIAEKFKLDKTFVADVMLFTTAFSLITLSLLLALQI
jgi:predicted permease